MAKNVPMSTTKKLERIEQFLFEYPRALIKLEFAFPISEHPNMSIILDDYEELEFFSDNIEGYHLISEESFEQLVSKNVNLSIRSLPKLNFYAEN